MENQKLYYKPLKATHVKITELRKQKKLSQVETAELLGISQNAYSRIERGETRLTIDRIKQIATLFKVPYIELITDKKGEFKDMHQDISVHHEKEKEVLENEIKEKNKYIKKLESTISDKEKIITDKDLITSLLQEKIKMLENQLKNGSQNG